jgi:GH18 family chitinase/aryl-phospho-beta-D-glucosidase BglC (GH1 family)
LTFESSYYVKDPEHLLRLKDISSKYNVICVAFAVPENNSHTMIIHGLDEEDKVNLKADINELQAQGKKILLSIGGATHPITLDTIEQKNNFVSSLRNLISEYDFDGIDIDIETDSLKLNSNDTNFKNPTTPRMVNLINGINEIYNNFPNKEFMLTAAPETMYFQPTFNPSTKHGAYLPILHALRDKFTFIHPQFYNSGPMIGGDGKLYEQTTPDFLVALTEPLITGFDVRNTDNTYTYFEGLRPDQVALGFLGTTRPSQGTGYMEWSTIEKALNYLIKGTSFGGKYVLKNPSGYPELRGVMTWSINYDKLDFNYAFADNAYEYFFGDEPVNIRPTVEISSHANGEKVTQESLSPITITVTASDSDGEITKTSISVDGQTFSGTSAAWTPSGFGTYNITATATDNDGATATNTISITVEKSGGVDPENEIATVNDSYSILRNTSGTFRVLSNDTGNSLHITGITEPTKGTAVISPDKTYISYSSYFAGIGTDSFQYTVTDANGNTALATVFVTINPDNPVLEGYYHTYGNQILDSNNNPVRIEGLNWFGFEATDRIPHGLWSRNYKEMMSQMKELGFNTIRLPFNNEMFNPGMMPSLNYWANPELEGLTPIQVMDKIVDYAGELGLKIILDHHRSDTQDVGALGSGLWYTDQYPESRWINDWKMLALRYNGNSTVIGADIHNEPHGSANWGQGGANDWKAAAEKCGNAILAVNPNWLIVVEGIESYNDDYYWWGGNLMGVKDHPITLNVSGRLVYSPHIYPNSVWNQPWFADANYPDNLPAIWDKSWGYIYKENIAPVLIGEFGSFFENGKDLQWLDTLEVYLKNGITAGSKGISWTYWCWNPNSTDTGGILKDDWISVHQNKMDYLLRLMNGGDSFNANPEIAFTSHESGEVLTMSSLSIVNVAITASDSDGEVVKISISVDGQLFNGNSAEWTPSGYGSFDIVAAATDDDGAVTSKSIFITIQDGNGGTNNPPVVVFAYPLNNSIIKQQTLTALNITITANDEDGSIAESNINIEGNTYDSSSISWTPSAFGTYSIAANATDDDGAITSARISITIQQSNSPIIRKQVIGYITQWDAWKGTEHGYTVAGINNQLNVDYTKFTMLNYSFFGVAKDGSLHSGDYRNKLIWKETEVQEPAPLIHDDIYSSWDKWLLYGSLPHTNEPKTGEAKGLIQLCDENGVNLMASIGGWSMCKHFSEMAADSEKKQRFLEGCRQLIQLGFDGIDIDWEYLGSFKGMNFRGTDDDYANFLSLIKDIRNVIGPDKLLTAAFSCVPNKLNGFNWSELDKYMDYYNIMSYDMAGGWSEVTGHNSSLYADEGKFSWKNTFTHLTEELGIAPSKINMGVAFYGRGVITNGSANLGAETVQRDELHDEPYGPPDGPIRTAHDYDNWKPYWGQPDYRYIQQNKAGWVYHWDDSAKVPYMTKGNYFLSYDDERSVQLKADYVIDNNIGGIIIWHVFGDWEVGSVESVYGNKFPYSPNIRTPLLDVLYHTFETNGSASHL